MAEEKTSCVLRLFGAPQGQLAGAVGQFAPQWKTQAQWKSRGGETLLALQAASPSGLKKAAQSLQAQFEADLYGAGDTSLAAAVVNALETHDRLLVCSDAAAGALLEARLETVPGAEKVFDFGALSYAHPKVGPQIEKRARARFKAEEPDAVRLALARAQAARRVVGSELAAGCAERGSEKVLVLSSKKGCWLRTVPSSDNAALWLLDMIRRAACDYPQAEGTGFLPARKAAQNGPAPEAGTNAAKPEPPPRKAPQRPLAAGAAPAGCVGGRSLVPVRHGRRLGKACPAAPAHPDTGAGRVEKLLAGLPAQTGNRTDITSIRLP